MKKILVIAIMLITSSCLFATTWNVYNGDSIQDIIDEADDGDLINVYNYYGEYDGFDFSGKDLDIIGHGLPTINGGSSAVVIGMSYIDNDDPLINASPTLKGFRIIGDSFADGVKLTYLQESAAIGTIENNVIEGLDKAIYVKENITSVKIIANELIGNDFGYYSVEDNYPNTSWADVFKYNTVYDNVSGLYLGYYSNTSAVANLIYDNDIGIELTDDIGQLNQYISIFQSTITNNDTGIYIQQYSDADITNSIIYGNDTQIEDDGGSITITYTDVEGDFFGTGNIDADPKFYLGDLSYGSYKYHLLEGSPCIDAGDPSGTDSDDTRLDMGCYPSTTDLKPTKGDHWNWVSYPRLDVVVQPDEYNAPDLLIETYPMPDVMDLLFVAKPNDPTLHYENPLWDPEEYYLLSERSYKINPFEHGHYILPEPGKRLQADHSVDIVHTQENWIGYWLPLTQKYQHALGDQLDYIDAIYAEDWYAYKHNGQWYGMGSGNNVGAFVYGKGYIIKASEDFELQWISFGVSEAYTKAETELFTYEDQPMYEAIDIESIENGENVIEIGVFQGDVCIGASKVEEFPVHLKAYTDDVNRNGELSFELATGRGETRRIETVQRYNFETGEYEKANLRAFESRFTMIKLGNSEDDLQTSTFNMQLSNHPNPFNPTTTIEFSIEPAYAPLRQGRQNEHNELIIYNMKGQKVKQLVNGEFPAGKHTVSWDGTDEAGKPVSSGIYLYKLRSGDHELVRKMIMLK